jgi:heme-degrading monooxygenase HmoA
MIVYEVNIRVQNDVADDYRAWLGDHVRHLLTLPGFLSAEVLIAEPNPDNVGLDEIVVVYRLESHHALLRYFAEHAPAMRARALERFAEKFFITRRVLAPLVEMVRTDP